MNALLKRRAIWILGLVVGVALLGGVMLLGHSSFVSADTDDVINTTTAYPHIVDTRLDTCLLCHTDPYPVSPPTAGLNDFGSAYYDSGQDVAAFGVIEGNDTDSDGFTNLEEINALFFPGDGDDYPPVLQSPPNDTVTTTQAITLIWQAASMGGTPSGYNVQLDGQIITTTGTTSSTLLSIGVHTWTVRAYTSITYSGWLSPAWTIEITEVTTAPNVPVLLSPPNATVTTTQAITLDWQAAATGETPTGYNVQLDGHVITTTGTMSPTILDVGVHAWSVRAYNAVGYSDWATSWTVEVTETLQPPGIPTLLAPPNGTVTTTQAITLAWAAGSGETPDGYNLELNDQVFTTTDTLSPTVLSVGIYTWSVRAYNAAGYSDWATPWTVEVRDYKIYLPLVLRH